MHRFLRAAFLAALVVTLANAATAQLTFTEANGPDLPGGDSGTPRLVAGPYIQNVSTSAVTVIWQTDVPSNAVLTISDGSSSQTYETSAPRRLSEVRVGKLFADTPYTYTITLTTGESAEGSFKTFPLASRPIKFTVYGDTRTRPDCHRQVAEAMANEPDIDFVLHTGDVVADGRKLESWIPEYLDPAKKLICKLPVFAVLGNHERNSANYFSYFCLPDNERWYSFDVADLHVIALDSNTSFDTGSDQYKWLMADLATHKDAHWKIVFMHHPTHTSGDHGSVSEDGVPREAPIRLAQELLPRLAAQFGITAVFAGHDHAYERSVRDGVSYIVSGGGGAPNHGQPNARHNRYRKVFYSGLHYCVVTLDAARAHMTVKTPKGKIIDRADL